MDFPLPSELLLPTPSACSCRRPHTRCHYGAAVWNAQQTTSRSLGHSRGPSPFLLQPGPSAIQDPQLGHGDLPGSRACKQLQGFLGLPSHLCVWPDTRQRWGLRMKSRFSPIRVGEGSCWRLIFSQRKAIPGSSWLTLVLRDVQHPPKHGAGSQDIHYLAQAPRLPRLRKAITPSTSFLLEPSLFSKSPEH